MRFLVDAQLPPALARWLVERGHEASHVFDLEMGRASDLDIWHSAAARHAIVVTKDEGFVTLRLTPDEGPPALWIRLGNTRRGELLAVLDLLLPSLVGGFERGGQIIEVVN